jgi:cytochrome c oxidase assembly factor CtaG
MSSTTNSILNLVANLIIFLGGFLFYYHYLTTKKIKSKQIYCLMRIFTALLLTGSLARVMFDFNVIYTGINENFNLIEAIIALSRNIGLGGVLVYITNKFKDTECEF